MKATPPQPITVTQNSIGNYLTLPKAPEFPDMTSNYQKMIAERTACTASGGSFSINGCIYPPPVISPQTNCAAWLKAASIDSSDPNVMRVINRESGCNPYAHNSSGACGIPQDIRGCEVGYDPVAQLIWMKNYVINRYGTWANAWQHEVNFGWY